MLELQIRTKSVHFESILTRAKSEYSLLEIQAFLQINLIYQFRDTSLPISEQCIRNHREQ